MSTDTIHYVNKNGVTVNLVDKDSAIGLVHALMVMDCTEPISRSFIQGNKQELDVYKVSFMDKSLNVIGLQDSIKVLHWMLQAGCPKGNIERYEEDVKNG